MIAKPLVSIVLRCFNQEKFVAEALDGLLAQTYAPLEIVIIDDCSTDRTGEIIQNKLNEHPERSDIKFVRRAENQGSEATCREGLLRTKGEFILMMAGDDIMLPNMADEMVKVWNAEGVSLVATNACYIDENSQPLGRMFREYADPIDTSIETLARDGSNTCCFGATIGIERDLYDTFGWPPAAFLRACDIMLPFYANLHKGAHFIKEPLLKYRVHSSNSSLSLMAERSQGENQLVVHEQIFNCHLAHAVLMMEELLRVQREMPNRYSELAKKIIPLLELQTVEMAKKLVNTRLKLHNAQRGFESRDN